MKMTCHRKSLERWMVLPSIWTVSKRKFEAALCNATSKLISLYTAMAGQDCKTGVKKRDSILFNLNEIL